MPLSALTTITRYTATIQILDYSSTVTASAGTTNSLFVKASHGLAVDDFIVNTSRIVNSVPESRRVTAVSGNTCTLNGPISGQTTSDSVRMYKFTDHTSLLADGSLNINRRVKGDSEASFQFNCTSNYIPRPGQYAKIFLNSALYHTGIIKSVSKKLFQDGITEKIKCDVQVGNLNMIPPRRTVIVRYPNNTTCSTIVNEMVNTYLVADGISSGTIQNGIVIQDQWVDDTISVGDVLDECENKSGFQWFIDKDFTLNFYQDTTISTCTYTIDDTSTAYTNYRAVSCEETIDNYVNKVFVDGGDDRNGNMILINMQSTASIYEMQNLAAGTGVYGNIIRDGAMNENNYHVAEAGTTSTMIVLTAQAFSTGDMAVIIPANNLTINRRTVVATSANSFTIDSAISGLTAGDFVVNCYTANYAAVNMLKRQNQIPRHIEFESSDIQYNPGEKLIVTLSALSVSSASYLIEEVNVRERTAGVFATIVRASLRSNDANFGFSTQRTPNYKDYNKNF